MAITHTFPEMRTLMRHAEYAALRSSCEAISSAGDEFTVHPGTVCRIIERSNASVWVVAFDDSHGFTMGKAIVHRAQLLPLCFSTDEVDQAEDVPGFDPDLKGLG